MLEYEDGFVFDVDLMRAELGCYEGPEDEDDDDPDEPFVVSRGYRPIPDEVEDIEF